VTQIRRYPVSSGAEDTCQRADFYYDKAYHGADPVKAWSNKLTPAGGAVGAPGLNWLVDMGKAHGKPIVISEWGMNVDAPAFVDLAAQWFKANAVAYQIYWDRDDETRAFARRFMERHGPGCVKTLVRV